MRCAEAAIAFARQQDFAQWPALNMICRGWDQLRQAFEAWRALGHELGRNQYLLLLADAYRKAGQPDRGLTAVAEGLEFTKRTGEHRWEAELHRLHGELLQLLPAKREVEAEACLHRALEVARQQQAKCWELRAATSLSRLWQSQGKCQDAVDLLAPVYGWFTEGFDTADLREANTLLETLSYQGGTGLDASVAQPSERGD